MNELQDSTEKGAISGRKLIATSPARRIAGAAYDMIARDSAIYTV